MKALETMKLSEIVEWKENPRDIDEAGMKRLKDKLLRLGQFAPLLLTEDDGFTVALGGNMRIKCMRELFAEGHEKFTDVWVTRLEFKKEGKRWYAFHNGTKLGLMDPEKETYESFGSKEEAMFVYSAADNSRDGHYLDDMVVKQIREVGVSDQYLSMLHLDTAYTTGLDALVARYDMADVRARGGGAETADRNTIKDKKESYDNATIKQIVLYYPTAEYEDMLDFLESIENEHEEVQSNTEAVNFLRNFYETHRQKS